MSVDDGGRVFELGPAVPDAREAFAVYKSYLRVPDTGDLVVCAAEELAHLVARWCDREDDGDGGHGYDFPVCPGYEGDARYLVRPTIARAGAIARTVDDAVAALQCDDEDEDDDQDD